MRVNGKPKVGAAVAAVMFLICGCGGFVLPTIDSLVSRQPQVLSVRPEDGSVAALDAVVEMEFSQPIDVATLSPRTLAIVKLQESSGEELIDDIVDGGVRGMEGTYDLDEGGRLVLFRAATSYEEGAYLIVATPSIMSREMLPLNQEPGMGPIPFVSRFDVGDSEQGGSDTGGGSNGEGASEDGATVVRNRPATVVINELLYDVPGSDTDGQVFVELLGDVGGDISGYNIYLINGDDGVTKDTIRIPDGSIIPDDGVFLIADAMTGQQGVSRIPGADLVDNFDPQNGPDCVQLVDDVEDLIDALGYGDVPVGTAENGLACYEAQPAPDATSGQSLSRIDGVDTDNNSVDFHVADMPTPGVM